MARRKRQLLEDDDSDSSNSEGGEEGFDGGDPDTREERELFDNPYKRQRRGRNGKDDAVYGVFGEDSEDEGFGKKKGTATTKRSDWTKAPAFVSSEKAESTKDTDDVMKSVDDDEDSAPDGGADDSATDSSEEGSEESRPPSPRIRDEDEEMDQEEGRPRFGGLGMGAAQPGGPSGTKRSGIGSSSRSGDAPPAAFSRGGIGLAAPSETTTLGFARGGLGSSSQAAESAPSGASRGGIGSSSHTAGIGASAVAEDLPTSFGGKPRTQRAFVRDTAPSPRPGTPLSGAEAAHFSKLSGSFGARMLQKLGWQAGQGLGTSGEGIVTPIESKLRPKGAGIAFKGFKERTDQSKAEAKRRGEVVSEDEDEVKIRKGKAPAKAREGGERSDAWKRPKKVKTKVEHKTYEQILAEAGEEPTYSRIGQIIDATGATVSQLPLRACQVTHGVPF